MKTFFRNISLLSVAVLLASCSWVDVDHDDCPSGFWLQLEYTYNMTNENLAKRLSDARVFVFDRNDIFVKEVRRDSAYLHEDNYLVNIPEIEIGVYSFVVWSGAKTADYDLPVLTTGISRRADLWMKLHNTFASNRRLQNLFYGKKDCVSVTGDYQVIKVGTMKDTNLMKCLIQSSDGCNICSEDYVVEIVGANGIMDFENRVATNDSTHYTPCTATTVEVADRGDTLLVARYAISTLRYMYGQDMRLRVIRNKDGEVLYDMPLTEELWKLVGSAEIDGREIAAQEYFDREDTYNVVFYMDKLGHVRMALNVKPWIVNSNDEEL